METESKPRKSFACGCTRTASGSLGEWVGSPCSTHVLAASNARRKRTFPDDKENRK